MLPTPSLVSGTFIIFAMCARAQLTAYSTTYSNICIQHTNEQTAKFYLFFSRLLFYFPSHFVFYKDTQRASTAAYRQT